MVALIDIDSLFYKAAYMLDTEENILKLGLQDYSREDQLGLLSQIGLDRLEQKKLQILLEIEKDANNIDISSVEVYLTMCSNPIRKDINPDYKANREPNELVNTMRKIFAIDYECFYSERYEADDLLADRAKELNGNCVIVTMDKDLKQCGGFIYDFYEKPPKRNAEGLIIESYPMRGLSYVSKWDAEYFLATQMLVGDKTDNIEGIKGVGKVKAAKLLLNCKSRYSLIRAVVSAYKLNFGEDYMNHLLINKRLLFLGANI